MAAQTLTDVTRNIDDAAISGLLNGEAITLNNSNLIINSDSRWGQQAAVLGNITISTSLGGNINIDGTTVWWVPFDASTGVVPTLGIAGVNDVTGGISGSGEFLGIWASMGADPLVFGSAIPSSGFIKLRRYTSPFIDNEIMTLSNGATVTINSSTGGQRGWISIVGADTAAVSVPRLGKFTSTGDWFYLGETNGSDDQTFNYPIADNCPSIQVETSVGSGVYEWWNNCGVRWGAATQFVSTDERGKFFGIDKTTGVITIARRASNACGFKPASGLRVRIPNILLSNSNSVNWNLNSVNATIGTRYEFTTTSAGEVDVDRVCGNWFFGCASPYRATIKGSSLLSVTISNAAQKTIIENCGFGIDTNIDMNSLTLSSLFSGVELTDLNCLRYASSSSNATIVILNDCNDVIVTNVLCSFFGQAASTDRSVNSIDTLSFQRCNNVNVINCSSVGGHLNFTTCNTVFVTNYKYADRLNGTTSSVFGISAIKLQASSSNISLDGFSYLYPSIADINPYINIITISTSNTVNVINFGTANSPISCGSANQTERFLSTNISTNITVRRCFFVNIRTSLYNFTNTTQNVVCENVWGDGIDVSSLLALNSSIKGTKMYLSQTGQAAVYGTHWVDTFTSNTSGFISVAANESTAETIDQVSVTSGTPKFNSSGSVQMPTVGDQITWTMNYFALGHTGLGSSVLGSVIGTLMQNFDYDYQTDTGTGYSSWKKLYSCRVRSSGGVAGTNTANVFTVTGPQAPQIGDYVSTVLGTQFSPGTNVTNISGTLITFSSNILLSLGTNVALFFSSSINSEPAINPNTGVKLKVRATTAFAGPTNAITYINIPTVTNAIDQQILYPLPVVLNLAKVAGIETGSRIRVYNVTTSTEIANEVVTGSEWSLLYGEGSSFTDGDVIEIRLAKAGYLPNSFITLATATGWTGLVSQEIDAIYALNAIDGSTVTELTGDFPNIQIDSNDSDGETTVQRIYAWFSYAQTSIQGIRDFFEAMLAEDEVNYRVRSTVANLKLDNTISTPLMIIGGRIYRDDGATVIATTSNSIQLDPDKAYAVSTSGSAPTVGEIWGHATRTLTSASIVRTELAAELARIDVNISSRNSVEPDNANIALIKAKTDTLNNTDLSGVNSELSAIKSKTNLIPALL